MLKVRSSVSELQSRTLYGKGVGVKTDNGFVRTKVVTIGCCLFGKGGIRQEQEKTEMLKMSLSLTLIKQHSPKNVLLFLQEWQPAGRRT